MSLFRKDPEKNFCCVIKTILADLRNYDDWKFEPWKGGSYREGYYYTLSSPAVSYQLFYRTLGPEQKTVGIYGVANTNDHFSQTEIDAVWKEIKKAEKEQFDEEESIIKKLFPGCYGA